MVRVRSRVFIVGISILLNCCALSIYTTAGNTIKYDIDQPITEDVQSVHIVVDHERIYYQQRRKEGIDTGYDDLRNGLYRYLSRDTNKINYSIDRLNLNSVDERGIVDLFTYGNRNSQYILFLKMIEIKHTPRDYVEINNYNRGFLESSEKVYIEENWFNTNKRLILICHFDLVKNETKEIVKSGKITSSSSEFRFLNTKEVVLGYSKLFKIISTDMMR